MSSDAYQLIGVIVVAVLALYTAVRSSRKTAPEGRSASAAEVEAMGKRLDAQAERMDKQDRLIRGLYEYIAEDHAEHRRHGWAVTPLPDHIA